MRKAGQPDGAIVASTGKGIEPGARLRMDRALEEVLDPVHQPRLL